MIFSITERNKNFHMFLNEKKFYDLQKTSPSWYTIRMFYTNKEIL